jgi:hypothetical protein
LPDALRIVSLPPSLPPLNTDFISSRLAKSAFDIVSSADRTCVQSLRPGVEVHGQRVTKMQLNSDTMTIAWTPRNRTTGQPLLSFCQSSTIEKSEKNFRNF